jgi:hypothetical protein
MISPSGPIHSPIVRKNVPILSDLSDEFFEAWQIKCRKAVTDIHT